MISISVLLLVSSRVTTSISLLGGMLSSLSSTVMMLLAAFAYMGFTMGAVVDGAKNMGFVTGGLGFIVTGLRMLRDIKLGILLTLGMAPLGLTFCLISGGGTDISGTVVGLDSRGLVISVGSVRDWRVIMGTKGGGLVKSGGG